MALACGRAEGESLPALAGDYGFRVDSHRLIAGLAAIFDRVSEIRPGDVLAIRIDGRAQHLAIAAPLDGKPTRAIQAWHTGPQRVVAGRLPRATIHSVWRWREIPASALPGVKPVPTFAEGQG